MKPSFTLGRETNPSHARAITLFFGAALFLIAATAAVPASAENSASTADKTAPPAPVFSNRSSSSPGVQFASPFEMTEPLTEEDKQDLKQVEEYFNSMPPVRARFIQRAQQWGGKWDLQRGTFKLKRPGKLRIEYDSTDDFIVADGKMIYNWDSGLRQQSQIRIEKTLAGFILQRDLSFSGDNMRVTKVERVASDRLEISIRSKTEPEAGELTLIINRQPLELEGWRVLDAQGLITEVKLSEVKKNPEFGEKDFIFYNPDFGSR